MITYPNTYTPSISKRTISTVKTYDEEGRLITEETVEEIEYASTQVLPAPSWQTPLISNTYTIADALDLDPPGQVE